MAEKSFLELLYGPHLPLYFKSVANTNMDGFSSAEPNKGLWEVFVYEQPRPETRFRSATPESRSIRKHFDDALVLLGQHLRNLEGLYASSGEDDERGEDEGKRVLSHLHSDKLTGEEQHHFDMFFNIVHKTKNYQHDKAEEISLAEFKKLDQEKLSNYRVNVKTYIKHLDNASAYTRNLNRLQKGGKPLIEKLALITCYFPLLKSSDVLTDYLKRCYDRFTHVSNEVHGTQVGGDNEISSALLRLAVEESYESKNAEQVRPDFDNVVSDLEIAEYLACNPEHANAVPSNTVTLAALPTNAWIKLSDGSYQKLKPQGYTPLSGEECLKVLRDTCAGSNIPDDTTCQNFMKAINEQNVDEILKMLTENGFVWESNVPANSVDKLHPETVLRILRTLGFGTKSGLSGKRVCSVDEWLNECVKSSKLQKVNTGNLKPNMRAYLEHLVSFVNSNPSLVDPSKQNMASMVSIPVPPELAQRGLYNAADDYKAKPNSLNWADVSKALQTTTCSGFNLGEIVLNPTMAYGAVGGQRGGTHLFTQATTAQLNLSSGISQMVDQVLKSLQATSQRLSADDEAKLRQKVQALTTLEQEILSTIMHYNQIRVAAEGGVNCYDQMRTTQDRLMQLGSVYDRRVPCLQELCEQLRMLLAQQQNKSGCDPL